MKQMIDEPVLTFAEAGRYLDLSRQRTHVLAKQGRLNMVRIGQRNYVTLRSVKHFLRDISEKIIYLE